MKICGLTLAVYRDKTFFKLLPKLNPKPDIFIIRNVEPAKEVWRQLQSIALGYNNYRKLAPDNITHYWIIEDDCIFPHNTLDILIDNLKQTKSDAITISVYNRYAKHIMVWNLKKTTKGKLVKVDINDKTGLKQVDVSSLNCFLIKKEVFCSEDFVVSNYNTELYVDTLFFTKLRKRGYTLYCNFDIRTEHGGLVWYGNEVKENNNIGL
jgi:hypothetical protein